MSMGLSNLWNVVTSCKNGVIVYDVQEKNARVGGGQNGPCFVRRSVQSESICVCWSVEGIFFAGWVGLAKQSTKKKKTHTHKSRGSGYSNKSRSMSSAFLTYSLKALKLLFCLRTWIPCLLRRIVTEGMCHVCWKVMIHAWRVARGCRRNQCNTI